MVEVIESWTPGEYEVTIDGQTYVRLNILGMVPIVEVVVNKPSEPDPPRL